MNLEKKYIDEKIWVIEDFLTQEELDWFKPWINDPNDWYITMRSPYKNIMNKFLNTVPEYDENGNLVFPHAGSEIIELEIFSKPGGIWDRLESVLPKHYKRHNTLQSFKYMTDEEIKNNLDKSVIDSYGVSEDKIDFAMYWHEDHNPNQPVFNASFTLYLNDDFEGGELEFLNKPISIKPKAGMLVGVPVEEGYTHRVAKVLGPNSRHTLYGNCWNDPDTVPVSTSQDC